jgi:hypothetical protein
MSINPSADTDRVKILTSKQSTTLMINTNINNYPKTANDHDVAPKVEKSPEEIKQNKTSAPTIT